ncbi:hypothetical protein, partial [Paenibacillus alba]
TKVFVDMSTKLPMCVQPKRTVRMNFPDGFSYFSKLSRVVDLSILPRDNLFAKQEKGCPPVMRPLGSPY